MISTLTKVPTEINRKFRLPFKIYISVNGEGYGHSSRALAVASHFDPECVLFGSYGYVLERLKRAGYPTIEVGPEVKFFGEDGSFEWSKTILANTTWPILVNRRTKEESRIIKQYGITCVLSDCRAAPVFAAAKLGLPAIYMTNQTQFDNFFQRRNHNESGRGVKSTNRFTSTPKAIQDAILGGAATPSVEFAARAVFRDLDEIIIADFPPPNTVCLPMLSTRSQVKKLQRMVGPLTAWRAENVRPNPRPGYGPYVVGVLGGHDYRLPLYEALIEAAFRLPNVQFDVFSSFRRGDIPQNLRLFDFTDTPECYYQASDLVVTQAGHSTAMELLTLGKQSLLVPDYKQSEQESNATRMVELGVSTQISYPELTGQSLAIRIEHQLQTRAYSVNAERISRIATNLDGSRQVADVVAEYASRVLAY